MCSFMASPASPCDGMTIVVSLTADMRAGNSAQLVGSDKCSVPRRKTLAF